MFSAIAALSTCAIAIASGDLNTCDEGTMLQVNRAKVRKHSSNETQRSHSDDTPEVAALGCPGSATGENSRLVTQPLREVRTGTANVRCCSGNHCQTSFADQCHTDKTFAEAQDICSSEGLRLCTEDEIESNMCCGTGCNFDFTQVWTSPVQISQEAAVSDDVYLATWHATGCPNPEPPAGILEYWRSVGWQRAFHDMHAYCHSVATGTARSRQIETCCGRGQQCAPANCAEQTTWAVPGDVPTARYIATWLATGCPNPEPPAGILDYWRRVGPLRTFHDMHTYCNRAATGEATGGQIRTCCGQGQHCTPTNCVEQTDFA